MKSPFKALSNPILIVGDNCSYQGGLSRIGRDLATLVCKWLPQYRVGYLGRGIGNTRRFPFVMYDFPEAGWGQEYIERTWNDFSNGEYGIILTTDDLSRRGWFADPTQFPSGMEKFLGAGRTFRKWSYTPIDSVSVNGALGVEMRSAALGYDRLLAASEWGRNVLIRSGRPDADFLPHGLFMEPGPFSIHPNPRPLLGWGDDEIWVMSCMANQSRKDFPVAFETAAHLRGKYGNRFHFLLHTDAPVKYWNIFSLAADYGVGDCLHVTQDLTDEQLALRYSAADCTILPSGGEGFGYPVAESLACGTPCIVADYAAAQELVEEECRVKPVTYRIDTMYNVQRAVLSGWGFASVAYGQIEKKRDDPFRAEGLRESVMHLSWERLKWPWIKWLEAGLR